MSKEETVQQAFESAVHRYIDFVEKHPQADKLGRAATGRLVDIVDMAHAHPIYRSIHAKYSAIKKEFKPPYQVGTPEKELMDAIITSYEAAYPQEKKSVQQAEVQVPAPVEHKVDKNEVNEKIKKMDSEIEEKQKSIDKLEHDMALLEKSLAAVKTIEDKLKNDQSNPNYKNKSDALNKNLDAILKEAEKQIEKRKGFVEYVFPGRYKKRVANEKFELLKVKEVISEQISGEKPFDAEGIKKTLEKFTKNLDANAKAPFFSALDDFDGNVPKQSINTSKIEKSRKEITEQKNNLNVNLQKLKSDKASLEGIKEKLSRNEEILFFDTPPSPPAKHN